MPRAALAEQLVGRWTLQSWTAGRADGAVTHPFGRKAQGTLIYTAGGWMTVQLAGQGSGLSSDEVWTNFDVHADTAARQLAYCGRYRTDGDVVIHDVTMSTFGQWVGTSQIRRCQLSGDILILRTEQDGSDRDVVENELRWMRAE
jgi:hypothetical protein